uniref:N-alpha-acetyltransferase 60 n=1 Tax=Guillardia theta TaxID=55529 RepID=A0A7S4K7N7_GUITH|mmetsp:Transcript_2168/g.6604  ORF Transcript_2168/g.6604 Transcript_2168/m.6604 type:complete len:301 (+) Transcript_2168:89-991(+)
MNDAEISRRNRAKMGQSILGEIPLERIAELPTMLYRALRQEDREQLLAIHEECFPVRYEKHFYDKALEGEHFSVAAFIAGEHSAHVHTPRGVVNSLKYSKEAMEWSTSPASRPPAECSSPPVGHERGSGEEMAAVIISQISCQQEFQDDVLRDKNKLHKVAYICTLGVWPKYRQHKLAKTLLQALMKKAESDEEVKAVSLHVLTTNQIAVKFYEDNGFVRLKRIPDFYVIGGKNCDAFLYAKYMHGGESPPSFLSRCALLVQMPLSILCSRLLPRFNGIAKNLLGCSDERNGCEGKYHPA